ncbi:MAG: hypothetical protein KF830_01655 [Planctomycetes bacterium]|nr:hypothetical protein [Planctomycetota bacterium]
MRTERSLGRVLLAALVADPWRKLMALGMAFGLWFFINGQIRGTVTRTVSLTCVGSLRTQDENFGDRLAVVLPTDRVVGRRFMVGDREIQSVRVILRGSRFKIDALQNQREQLDLQISGFAGLDWSTRRDVEFTAADIRRDTRVLQGVDIGLEPSRIRLEVERIDEWELRLGLDDVEVDVGDEDVLRRLRLDTAEFQPPIARILGPASAIARVRQPGPKPLRARVRRIGSEQRQVSAVLELVAARELDLRLAEVPTVTFQVLPVLQTFQFELPLVVDDLALPPEMRGVYRADARSLLVRIRAGGQLRARLLTLDGRARQQEWAAANLRLLVVVPRPEPGAPYGQELVLEARLLVLETAQLTVDPTERLLDEAVSVTLRRLP